MIKPIERVNVSEQVFQQLKDHLIKGVWAQGEKIPSENELCEQFGVSRITVRQAIQKLGVLGLLETKLGEGSFVRTIKASDSMNALIPTIYLNNQCPNSMNEIQEFREIIEVESARLATEKATDDDLTELKMIYQNMKQFKNDIEKFAKEDFAFHLKIGQMTKNDLLIKTYMILREVLQLSMVDIIETMGCDSGIYYHGELIKAIEKGNGVETSNLMREHLSKNRDYYI